jgi:SagB-type dehydrogenase family enzyme
LSRRQALGVGGVLGAFFSLLRPFSTSHALPKEDKPLKKGERTMKLMKPDTDGKLSVERAILKRRTVRSFSKKPITQKQLSQILWAAQGITEEGGFKRAAPSAGALYPSDVYTVVGDKGVKDLPEGVYHYDPGGHEIEKIHDRDEREAVAMASVRQMWMAEAPVIFVITSEYDRITVKYGERGIRYAFIEVGHIGQNIFLQCQALGLAAGIVGAYYDKEVAQAIKAKRNHEPLIIMPIGWQG